MDWHEPRHFDANWRSCESSTQILVINQYRGHGPDVGTARALNICMNTVKVAIYMYK